MLSHVQDIYKNINTYCKCLNLIIYSKWQSRWLFSQQSERACWTIHKMSYLKFIIVSWPSNFLIDFFLSPEWLRKFRICKTDTGLFSFFFFFIFLHTLNILEGDNIARLDKIIVKVKLFFFFQVTHLWIKLEYISLLYYILSSWYFCLIYHFLPVIGIRCHASFSIMCRPSHLIIYLSVCDNLFSIINFYFLGKLLSGIGMLYALGCNDFNYLNIWNGMEQIWNQWLFS